MDNSTFELLDMEEKSEADSLEEYRFVFLEYLNIAKKVALLKNDAKKISAMRRIWNHGRILERTKEAKLQEEQALEAERLLSSLYSLDRSPEGYERAEHQFNAELAMSKERENDLWDKLCSAVTRIEEEFEVNEPVWFDSDPEKQHAMFVDDLEALDRIAFYQNRLRRFDKTPETPYTLETVFELVHGSLIDAVPFHV